MLLPRSALLRFALVVPAILVISGCGGSSTPTPAVQTVSPLAAPSPSFQVDVSPSVVTSPSTSPTTAVPLCAKEFTSCPLPAGTYSTSPFNPPFTFAVGAGWQNDRAWPDGGEIALLPGGAVQWASGVHEGFMAGFDKPSTTIGPAPADFIAYLRKFKGFTVTQPTPVTIGGAEAQQVDVLTNKTSVRGIYMLKQDAANFDPGEKVRFFVLEKDGKTVILTIESFQVAGFDAFLTQAQSVIDSIAWLP